jgi:hypothetical protein
VAEDADPPEHTVDPSDRFDRADAGRPLARIRALRWHFRDGEAYRRAGDAELLERVLCRGGDEVNQVCASREVRQTAGSGVALHQT